jgi:hypothetical protein
MNRFQKFAFNLEFRRYVKGLLGYVALMVPFVIGFEAGTHTRLNLSRLWSLMPQLPSTSQLNL